MFPKRVSRRDHAATMEKQQQHKAFNMREKEEARQTCHLLVDLENSALNLWGFISYDNYKTRYFQNVRTGRGTNFARVD